METNIKQANDAFVAYVISFNRQAYDFGTKMVKDYVEFTQSVAKMYPNVDMTWLPTFGK